MVEGEVVLDNYVRAPRDEDRLGICCSGGGIRSASYNLGALQVLRRSGELDAAQYLAAVSGGGYIAAAHAITAAWSDPEVFAELPPWAPGSPEERLLRNHSTYLAPGLQGWLWLTLNLVYGLVVNLAPIALGAFALGRTAGWWFHVLQPGLRRDGVDVTVGSGTILPLLGLTALAFLCLFARRIVEQAAIGGQPLLDFLEAWAPRCLLAAAGWAAFFVGLPLAVAGLRNLDVPDSVPFGRGRDVVALLTAIGVVVGAGTAAWAARRAVSRLKRLLAAIAGPVLIAAPVLLGVNGGVNEGLGGDPMRSWVPAIGLGLLAFGVLASNVRWSMHLFYKERLSTVFAVRRVRREDGLLAAEPIPYRTPLDWAELNCVPPPGRPGHVPELIACAAVNVSDEVVPPGRASGSFTFTRTLSGGPLTKYVSTARLADEAVYGRLTVPAAMAISGAALSPSMGKLTRSWLRLLMALFNVRLGVWVPNPARLLERPETPDDPKSSKSPSLWDLIKRGWDEPGVLYVLYEGTGLNRLDKKFVYVTDGGHWENLGLVELLRRGCTRIYCFDAAGDARETFNILGDAVALARSELGAEILIDPAADGLLPDPKRDGYSSTDVVTGTIRYPNGVEGVLLFAKAALPIDSPWDVKAYAKRDRRFPAHSTGDQFFSDEQFESYRALGAHAARRAVTVMQAHPARADRPE